LFATNIKLAYEIAAKAGKGEVSMARRSSARVDTVKYEMFLHRLWAIGEEGRSSIQKVTASPISM
jgi:hypothetical protein